MYFILKGADFSTANLGQITVVEGSVGTGGTTIDPNAKYTLTVTPTPSDATVVLTPEGGTAVTGTTIEVTRGTKVTIELSKTGYVSQTFTTTVYGDKTYPAQIFAESVKTYTLTINPNPASATVTIEGVERKTITVAEGTSVTWVVSASGYTSQTDAWLASANETLNITLVSDGSGSGGTTPDVPVGSGTTWYLDHTNQVDSFTSSVNIAGRGWTHKPGTAGYNAYIGKPVNTIGFFTTLASQNITIGKVAEKGGEADMTEIATVTATNPSGTTKGFCSVTFPTVTLNNGECLVIFAQTDDAINFYYNGNSSVTDANGIVDGNFYGRVPKVYGSGTAWTAYTEKICLGLSVGYNSDVA